MSSASALEPAARLEESLRRPRRRTLSTPSSSRRSDPASSSLQTLSGRKKGKAQGAARAPPLRRNVRRNGISPPICRIIARRMDDFYRDYILDHYRNPRDFGTLENADASAEDVNPLCGDQIRMELRVDDAGAIADIRFSGKG